LPLARWCESCLHPIDPDEDVWVEAYRTVGEFERKVYFHNRCFEPGNPAYVDALMRYSDGRVTAPIKKPSIPATTEVYSRGRGVRRLKDRTDRSRRRSRLR
jgi:hypothetical protein